MSPRAYLGPGRPLNPVLGYSGRPRATDYPMSVNIATQGRAAWGRPSYEVLKKIIDAYDVARMCVNHKIDELRSMEPMFLPADGVKDDVDDEIAVARLVLAKPDRELPFESWLSKWLENAVKYDSAPLYRRRNYGGDVIALEVVDGKTFHPYIDENGRRPEPPDPAYYQTIHGMVAQWLTTDDAVFEPFRPQEDSPYGMAPIESILLTANTDLRFQWHFLQMFTDGSVPAGFMELPPDISSPDQVAEWQDYWDAMVMGDQAKLAQLIAVPNGTKLTQFKPNTFDKTFPQYLMTRTCAAFGVVPQDLGLIEDVNRANGETQVDIQFRVNTLPWVLYVQGVLTRYLQQDIGLRVKVDLDTGRDKEDRLQEAQAHQLYVEMGAESPDEVRSEVLGLPIDKERPTPRFVLVQRVGPIPLLSIEGIAGKTDPETHGPAQDQPALDQPYVPPVGVVPTPGTTDDKASLAANDQYQQYVRRTLEDQPAPNRETREQKRARGAKTMQDQADAHAQAAQGAEATAPEQPQQPKAAPVAKARLDGEEAGELLAFRAYVAVRKRRGAWDRDFLFQHVNPAIARHLNAGGRAEVIKAAPKPDALRDADPVARKVYNQLLADFPPEAIGWVLNQDWRPEQLPDDAIDWDHVHTWTATHEPGKVRKLAKKMAAGGANRRAIAIARPGKPTVMLADGHHHAEAHRLLGEKTPAFVAHVAKVKGPWDEMHASQYGDADIMKAATLSKAEARYRDPSDLPGRSCGDCTMFRGPGSCTLVAGDIAAGAVCDRWEATGPKAAGTAVRAADTGRVLMLQRGLDGDDPAAGSWEFPGGCIDEGERPADAASREWEEEVGCRLPDGEQTGTWTSLNGVYVGHVWTIPAESAIQIDDPRDRTLNPDDPGRDHVEAIAWWDPAQLTGNPAVRRELAADMPRVQRALGARLAKAADPKAPGQSPSADDWPGWKYDLEAAQFWAPRIAAALLGAFDVGQLVAAYLASRQQDDKGNQEQQQSAIAIARVWLAQYLAALMRALRPTIEGVYADGYVIGAASAQAYLAGQAAGEAIDADLAHWSPGDADAARLLLGQWGDGAGLRQLLAEADVTIKSIAETRLDELGRILGQGLAQGLSAQQIAEQIRGLLTNQSRALMIAVTEMCRAVNAAAKQRWIRAGLLGKQWLSLNDTKVCPICRRNQDAGVVPINEPYPSGDDYPPAHPNERCVSVGAFVEE